ncbi:MAG: ComEC/Rec2 family competence protein, partial [bacterium]|nr:ComEC/Rec2 family competence protein [bacterium]
FIASHLPNFPPTAWLIMALGFFLLTWANRATIGWRWALISLVAFSIGGWRYASLPQTSDVAQYNQQGGIGISVIGEVIALPNMRDTRQLIRLNAIQVVRGDIVDETSGVVLVVAPPNADIAYGDMLKVTGELITPQTFDTFSYADYLARTGVFSIMDKTTVQVLSRGGGSPFIRTLADIRATVSNTILRALPEPASGLLIGMILGDEQHIAPDVSDAFSATGTSHIIAISGFNMVIVAGVVQSILTWLMPNRRWWVLWIALAVMGIYTTLAGANAAVLRAALMTSVLLIGQTLRRNTYVPASLAFVVLVMSFITPSVFWDVSFQLSFAAVLGLSVFVPPLQRAFNSGVRQILPQSTAQTLSNWLTEPLIVSIAAQITTMPIILANFGRFSLVALPVNLLIVPIQAYLLILGVIAVGIGIVWIPFLSHILFWLTYLLLNWTIGMVRLFASLPFADVDWRLDPRLALLFYVGLVGGLIMTATQPRFWRIFIGTIQSKFIQSMSFFGALGVVLLIGGGIISRPDGKLHVWFLTMGHNNAVLIQTPDGAQILVDGGSYPSRLLTALGDTLPFYDQTIEMLIVTQPDDFDTRAILDVLGRYEVGISLWHGQGSESEIQSALDSGLQASQRVTAKAGYSATFSDGTRIEVLNPTNAELSPDFDDNTIVLRVIYGDISFLLAGDLSAETQSEMINNGVYAPSTVLQMPKHGGARTLVSDFLDMVAPSVVVLQADPANRLGDPSEDTLSLLGNIPLWRTDLQGVIHFWTDGERLWAQGDE